MIVKMRDTVNVASDKFFNNPDEHKFFEDIGVKVNPVDLFGAFVPLNKSIGNLKKMEESIQKRFSLHVEGKDGE